VSCLLVTERCVQQRGLQPRIDRLTFHRHHREHALVNASERFSTDESFQGFNAQRELSQGERSFGTQSAGPEAIEILGAGVFGAVDDADVLGAARLNEFWTLTQTGNWKESARKINSDGDVSDAAAKGVWNIPEFDEDRTNNHVNEILGRTSSGAIAGTFTPTHDLAGQMIDDGRIVGSDLGRGFQYDAFGRLVEVRKVTSRTGGTGVISAYTVMAEYRYDGLGQRTAWHRDFDGDGTAESSEKWLYMVYDDRWRAIAIYHQDDDVTQAKEITVPHNAGFDGLGGSSYIDSYALRDADDREGEATLANLATANSDGVLDSRGYYLQNWRADLVSMIGSDGCLPGWFKYSAYGQHQWISAGDIDGGDLDGFRDGVVDANDLGAFMKWHEDGDPRADLNFDGAIDSTDYLFLILYDASGQAPESRVMYAGYMHDPLNDAANSGGQFGIYHVRHRVYSPELGRWTRRDPLGYVDGMNLYGYVSAMVLISNDPTGQFGGMLCAMKLGKWLNDNGINPSMTFKQLCDTHGCDKTLTSPNCKKEYADAINRPGLFGTGNQKGVMGITLCCDGKPHVCLNCDRIKGAFSTNRVGLVDGLPNFKKGGVHKRNPIDAELEKGLALVAQCVLQHERVHENDIRCGTGANGFEEEIFGDSRNQSEVRAYDKEIECYQAAKIACGSDVVCKAMIDLAIKKAREDKKPFVTP
jgi:RHS repeat-associated protein